MYAERIIKPLFSVLLALSAVLSLPASAGTRQPAPAETKADQAMDHLLDQLFGNH